MYSVEDENRFWIKVKKLETGLCCWEWTACLTIGGYGIFRQNDRNILSTKGEKNGNS
jgi:hypothetical protein